MLLFVRFCIVETKKVCLKEKNQKPLKGERRTSKKIVQGKGIETRVYRVIEGEHPHLHYSKIFQDKARV